MLVVETLFVGRKITKQFAPVLPNSKVMRANSAIEQLFKLPSATLIQRVNLVTFAKLVLVLKDVETMTGVSPTKLATIDNAWTRVLSITLVALTPTVSLIHIDQFARAKLDSLATPMSSANH